MNTINLGDVSITRVEEWDGLFSTVTDMFPDGTKEFWQDNRDWLAPDHWDPESGAMRGCLQTFVVRSEGKIILIDTGAGNNKERPYIPIFGHLDTDFLENLAAAGVEPQDVDLVINTHVHIDHVGWNTYLAGREWVPTFPNAKYLMAQIDFDFWNPLNGHDRRGALVNQNMFEDSVAPVQAAGQAVLWNNGYEVDANLRIELAPGHTPGLGVIKLQSGSDRAVFVGDLMHSPAQVVQCEWNSCFCEDPDQARRSRRAVLSWAADNNALVIPAHYAGAHAVEVARDGDAFRIKGWGGF
jgi:glyoxylase-like metal-dependent hydrolase (beta-lactamase superfamily II)